ncbi:hypothetical protein [Nocardia sp. NPDC058497]|uniref:hypothetical protein n=1 Tax=Nocardia sp. NPDC058497 TaxID=3346529 RepID=UPI003665F6C1
MSPDKRPRAKSHGPKSASAVHCRTRPSADDAHEIVYFRTAEGKLPGRDYIEALPAKARAKAKAALIAVAAAPPKRFSGGGYWEAMHGEMTGWFEIRCDSRPLHYRIFCRLDYEAIGRDKPLLVVVGGLTKAYGTTFSRAEYQTIRDLGAEYSATNPRSVG